MSYEFTEDWFSANAKDWARVFQADPTSYLEIGSFEGRSACTVITNLPRLKRVVCIDAWEPDPTSKLEGMTEVEKRFDKNIFQALKERMGGHMDWPQPNVRKQKGRSFDVLTALHTERKLGVPNALAAELFDLIYIDGSHLPEHCLEDMVLAFRLLRTGGVMIVDDYLWVGDQAAEFPRTPKIAVDAFTTIYWPYCRLAHRQSLYQVYIVKTGDIS